MTTIPSISREQAQILQNQLNDQTRQLFELEQDSDTLMLQRKQVEALVALYFPSSKEPIFNSSQQSPITHHHEVKKTNLTTSDQMPSYRRETPLHLETQSTTTRHSETPFLQEKKQSPSGCLSRINECLSNCLKPFRTHTNSNK